MNCLFSLLIVQSFALCMVLAIACVDTQQYGQDNQIVYVNGQDNQTKSM